MYFNLLKNKKSKKYLNYTSFYFSSIVEVLGIFLSGSYSISTEFSIFSEII